MSHETEVKYILGILELLEVRRVTIGDSRTGKLVSRERFAELLAPHVQPRTANLAPHPTYYVGHPDGSFTVADPQP